MDDARFCGDFENKDIEDMFKREISTTSLKVKKEKEINEMIEELLSCDFETRDEFNLKLKSLTAKYKMVPSKPQLYHYYRQYITNNNISRKPFLELCLKKKIARSALGVVVITIFTSPSVFSCPKNCHYCPEEKDSTGKRTQPRSYLSEEPGCMRATMDKFHPVLQTYDRIQALDICGHIDETSKLEFIVSGGTFNFYPKDYLRWFMTGIYYACNTFYNWKENRPMMDLIEEQNLNEKSNLRVIGLTIETRPDYITPRKYRDRLRPSPSDLSPYSYRCKQIENEKKINYDSDSDSDSDSEKEIGINLEEIRLFREYGVTRIQIGIQHTDKDILDKVNRECSPEQNMWGIYVLKQNGFKVDIHLMLDLPGTTPEKDSEMLNKVLDDPMYQADQWKIYPTAVVNFTRIKEWYERGEWKPYAELEDGKLLRDVIKNALVKVHPWIRINRVIRDIPSTIIIGGNKDTSMRDKIDIEMEREGIFSKDIRSREVKDEKFDSENIKLKVRAYNSSFGREFFISYESLNEKILYGFIRLRLNMDNYAVLPELWNTALIRELHVYGMHTGIAENLQNKEHRTQHRGLGKKLLKTAERIAFQNGFKKISVISGVGVREYYRKNGYHYENTYMMKNLDTSQFLDYENESIYLLFIIGMTTCIFCYFIALMMNIL